jgi:hypothetical protein
MKVFEFHFTAETLSDSDTALGCELKMSGPSEKIGQMFAIYCQEQLKRGQSDPIRVLIAAFEQMQKINPKSGIIGPVNPLEKYRQQGN